MTSTKNLQNTHISAQLRALHLAMLEIVGAMSRPQRDDILIEAAGLRLDRALFPLLVIVERFGPIGVVDLADRVGRDHSTVSRQIAKLETLGLVARQAGATDRRVREAVIAPPGQAMTARIDAARERLVRGIFEDWAPAELDDFVRLLRRFADAYAKDPPR
jgi:DNA-binding MarR family transcriptional regulator